MKQMTGKQSIAFEEPVYIASGASLVGEKNIRKSWTNFRKSWKSSMASCTGEESRSSWDLKDGMPAERAGRSKGLHKKWIPEVM